MKILLTGGSGLLGQALQMLWLLRNFEKEGQILHAPSSKELDITKPIDSKKIISILFMRLDIQMYQKQK
jgi:dTDP-4-dehydrorhamnose reductase